MKKQVKLFGVLLSISLVCVATISAQPGPAYELPQHVKSSGGGSATDAASSRGVTGTIAQPIAGTKSSGGVFAVSGGFWVAVPALPTAAPVTISGRVIVGGRGLRSATVSITDDAGATRTVSTGRFGNYRIDEVEAGHVYVIAVASRRFDFTPQVMTVIDNLTGIDFVLP